MGLSELMARVVSGIETPTVAASLAFFTADVGDTASGVAALAVPWVPSVVILNADAAIATTIIHRIFMKTLANVGCGFESYPRRPYVATRHGLINQEGIREHPENCSANAYFEKPEIALLEAFYNS
jgi:hypothetical protein